MNVQDLKALSSRILLAAASLAMLAGFAAATSRVESRMERALESVVTAQGRLCTDAASTLQLSTVVITGKSGS